MAIQQIMEKAFYESTKVLYEKAISPSADLTPVYVGKFCYIGKLALDEYDLVDQRILCVAALILTGAISWKKGWSAFKWVPEFILPVALEKVTDFCRGRYIQRTDQGMQFKSKKDHQMFTLTIAIATVVFRSLESYLMRSRNPKIYLKAMVPLHIAIAGYMALFQWYRPSIFKYTDQYCSKKYCFEIVVTSNMGLYLLFSYFAGKGIEKGVGAPILTNRKFTLISSAACLMVQLLMHSPNFRFNKTQE
ncbi:MAG: hypothetical protein H7A41_08245 [Chlamydiales bacterium]|nr:hypothetical protein [Chlamydiales bacterium]